MSEEIVEVKGFRDYLNVYEFETILPGTGQVVKFKPITTGQLKKLLIYEKEENPAKIEAALDEMISSCVVSEDFNIGELYLQDRFFLLLEIRKKTKGNIHQWQYTCPKCDSQSLQNFDLDDVPVNKKPEKFDDIVELNENIKVKMSYIIRKDQNRLMRTINPNMSDLQYMTELMILTHAHAIKSIITPEGENKDVPDSEKKYLLENIPTGVYEKIRNWFTDNDFGADLSFDVICNNCEHKQKIDVPVDDFFL